MAKSKLVPLRIFPVLALALGQYASAQTPRLSRTEAEKRADAPLIKMTLDEKLVGGIDDFYTQAVRRLAIQQVRMSDGPLGVHDYGPTTAYPAPIALTASWDLDLARRVAENMSKDGRARGVHFIVAPGLNLPCADNGRNFEYLGEDNYLAARFAVALVEGIQSQALTGRNLRPLPLPYSAGVRTMLR